MFLTEKDTFYESPKSYQAMFTKTYIFHLLQKNAIIYCIKCFLEVTRFHYSKPNPTQSFQSFIIYTSPPNPFKVYYLYKAGTDLLSVFF